MSSLSRIVIVAMTLASAGCQWAQRLTTRDQFGPKATCALPPEATKDEIVAYLNRNVLPEDGKPALRGWKTDAAKVYVSGVPMGANAAIQVEAPRNLRLRVAHPISQTAMLDIGSNAEQFWVWSKDAPERVVLTCRHEEIGPTAANLSLPIPFQPDWLMEVLGVIPLDPNEFRMQRGAVKSQFVELIADCHGPTGEPVRRIIQVDACHGIITRQSLVAADGKEIASASFISPYRHADTQMVFYKKIRVDLPKDEAGKKMFIELDLDRIQVNPSVSEDSVVWSVPKLEGHRMVDLAEMARSRTPVSASEQKYVDASDEFALRSGRPAAGAGSDLEAPNMPPRANGAKPKLSFEPEANQTDAAPFSPPGTEFEMPAPTGRAAGQPAAFPTGNDVRGQSPTESTASPTEKSGFMTRLKDLFTPGPKSVFGPPSEYSRGASRSSWGQPRLGQE